MTCEQMGTRMGASGSVKIIPYSESVRYLANQASMLWALAIRFDGRASIP
jgi:hypothetical protein